MNTYKLLIQYKGTHYQGWQVQPTEKTIQGELNKVLEKISKTSEIKSLGSGRTDSGVHALGQVVKISIPIEIGAEELLRGVNSLLPQDIKVMSCESCSEEFNPVRDALKKEYVYLFSLKKNLSPFHYEYISPAPSNLNLQQMEKACELFIGRHNFQDFQCVGTDVSSTVREIFECSLEKFEKNWGIFPPEEEVFALSVVGEGFLKQMVRLMVGSLWNIGSGKTSLEALEKALSSPTGDKLGPVAPPQGLYLKRVFYS